MQLSPNQDRRVAAALSLLLPGLGQLYRGERAKALGVLCAAVGMLGALALAIWGPPGLRSGFTVILLAVSYPFVLFPAIADAWRDPQRGRSSLLDGESVGYVIFLLAMVGPMALPILWQSSVIPRLAKVLLTVFVIGVALAAIVFLLYLGPILERLIPEMLELLREA